MKNEEEDARLDPFIFDERVPNQEGTVRVASWPSKVVLQQRAWW